MSAAAEKVRARRAAIGAFAVAIGGGVLSIVAAIADVDRFPDPGGIGLAVALGGIGFGLVSWSKSLDLDERVIESRAPLGLTSGEQDAIRAGPGEIPDASGRRRVLGGLLGGALAVLGLGLVGPVASLGSLSTGDRSRTRWRAGSRLATPDGQPVAAATERFD